MHMPYGPTDTIGLVVARAERRLISELVPSSLGKVTHVHYHLHMTFLSVHHFTGVEL